MVLVIPKSLVKIYENWDIRGGVLLSFSLQVFLVLFAPIRKRSNRIFVGSCIWFAYLLADWAPSFSAGLIFSDSFNDVKNSNASSSKDNLMAFWAPFLLLHFGGSDTITAFALADNQLWPRQIPTFFLQVGASVYVFILTLPGNTLWIPTVLIFIAGIIKYTERTHALYKASKLPLDVSILFDSEYTRIPGIYIQQPRPDALRDAEILGEEIKAVTREAADLRKIEDLLELLYEMFYTKALVLHNKKGLLLRFIAFSFTVVALGVFTSVERNGSDKFNQIDVIVTYTLLYGAICLDTISLLNLVFSEWTIVECSYIIEFQENSPKKNSFTGYLLKFYKDNVAKHVLSLRRQRWSKCKKEPYTNFQALSTPLPFRKWCGSIPRYNLLRYCQRRPENQVLKGALYKVAEYLGTRELLEMSLYKANSSFLLELWQFIFNELNTGVTVKIQDWERQPFLFGLMFEEALLRAKLNEESVPKLMSFVRDTVSQQRRSFDKFIIMWHVATSLCYAADDEHEACKADDERHFSKLLSDYMLYLLIMQPNMLSEVLPQQVIEGQTMGRYRFEHTCDEAIEFFRQHKAEINRHKEQKKEMVACRCLLTKMTSNAGSGSYILSKTCEIARELQNLEEKKWKFIGTAWILMLLYAAQNSKSSSHIEQLPRGGELISMVWMLDFLNLVPLEGSAFS